jgi:predicted Zn-dependent protease
MKPLITAGYKPTETDERGLWQQYERVEQEIAGSNLLIKDKALASYVGGLTERVGGPAAKDLRIYVARIPEFNAFIAPTGFMVVFSGLLTRMRDEAQLSGVIAHEAGHFLRRHHIRGWRDLRRKTDVLSFVAMGAGVGGSAAGVYLGRCRAARADGRGPLAFRL